MASASAAKPSGWVVNSVHGLLQQIPTSVSAAQKKSNPFWDRPIGHKGPIRGRARKGTKDTLKFLDRKHFKCDQGPDLLNVYGNRGVHQQKPQKYTKQSEKLRRINKSVRCRDPNFLFNDSLFSIFSVHQRRWESYSQGLGLLTRDPRFLGCFFGFRWCCHFLWISESDVRGSFSCDSTLTVGLYKHFKACFKR